MSTLILLGLAGLVYLLVVIVRPLRECPKCRGSRVVPVARGYKTCPKCRGTGQARRRGAVLVHRTLWEHAGPKVRDALHDRADRLKDQSKDGAA